MEAWRGVAASIAEVSRGEAVSTAGGLALAPRPSGPPPSAAPWQRHTTAVPGVGIILIPGATKSAIDLDLCARPQARDSIVRRNHLDAGHPHAGICSTCT